MSRRLDILQGTLDLLILQTLTGGSLHGYAIARHIEERAGDLLRVEEGSLYPALHRMEHKGWLKAEWGPSENNRRAKYYRLTAKGRTQLTLETENWTLFTEAVARIVRTT